MIENNAKIVVYCDQQECQADAEMFAQSNGFTLHTEQLEQLIEKDIYALAFASDGLTLRYGENKKLRELRVSFISGAKDHRRKYGGGRGQAIAKAVGLGATQQSLSILDATAGQGGDAFVLASLGCELTLLERSPIAYALLNDALVRGRKFAEAKDAELSSIFSRMRLLKCDFLSNEPGPELQVFDVVYLDPMFPERKKSAAVKKEMRIFHDIIGRDVDADVLLNKALGLAKYRVVVKRPLIAPFLGNVAPSYQLKGKSSRFDIYVNKSLKVNA